MFRGRALYSRLAACVLCYGNSMSCAFDNRAFLHKANDTMLRNVAYSNLFFSCVVVRRAARELRSKFSPPCDSQSSYSNGTDCVKHQGLSQRVRTERPVSATVRLHGGRPSVQGMAHRDTQALAQRRGRQQAVRVFPTVRTLSGCQRRRFADHLSVCARSGRHQVRATRAAE